jgi:hypothetical protein
MTEDDWVTNRKLIVAELRRIGDDVRAVTDSFDKFRREDIAELKIDIALLKLKSSLWGAVLGGAAGMLVTAGAIMLRLVK